MGSRSRSEQVKGLNLNNLLRNAETAIHKSIYYNLNDQKRDLEVCIAFMIIIIVYLVISNSIMHLFNRQQFFFVVGVRRISKLHRGKR